MDPLPHRETGLQSFSESQGPKWEPGSRGGVELLFRSDSGPDPDQDS